MPRHLAALPLLTMALSVGACGIPAAARAADAWPALAPLLADTYSGACRVKSGDDDGPAAITVSVDGKLAAPGIAADLRAAAVTRITRKRGKNGANTDVLLAAMYDEWHFVLVPNEDGGNAAEAKQDGRVVACDSVGPLAKLNRRPLAKAFASLLDVTATVDCRATMGETPHRATLRIAQGTITLDGHTLDVTAAQEELLGLASERGMQYSARLPDGRLLGITYDERGMVRLAALFQGEAPLLGCGPDA